MNLLSNIIINVYSIGIVIIIYIFSIKQNDEDTLQNKLYKGMLRITILMLLVDILSRFDGRPETIYLLFNQIGNFTIFLLGPVISSLWLLYVHDQIFKKEEKTKRLLLPILIVNGINIVFLLITQVNGWYYFIDSGNIYHRGAMFWMAAFYTDVFMIAALILTLMNRDKINRKQLFSLMFFAVPPLIGTILQIAFYGISIVLNGIVFSILIVSLNIQNTNMYTDYLTGVYNRKKLESYLKQKISASSAAKTFSAIMVDLDNFKLINDTYGHDVGDNALQVCTTLLSNSLRSNDIIARFGGDEFFVVLDISEQDKLEEIAGRIRMSIDNYNRTSGKPYKIGFSMGYAVYDYTSNLNSEDFQKRLDTLMYENKVFNKGGANRESDNY
jgi:diguanylate cyclase (GGDEF)-like protein